MDDSLISTIIEFIKKQYPGEAIVPLHRPIFSGKEKEYLLETIDSSYVSSIGQFVDRFERMMCELTTASFAVAVVNGTNALHLALLLSGVQRRDEVISQSLTFIATCNAISYIGANPVFIDVDKDTLGMSPASLKSFLEANAEQREDGFTYNSKTGNRIKSCVPMHTFGFPCKIDAIKQICDEYNITLIEDAAESIGSYYKDKHTGTFGTFGVFSLNGNKTITSGGGGVIITNDIELGKKAKHITCQAKVSHPWAFIHDQIGYNYRMPNLNAALACAQMEQLESFIQYKRGLAKTYELFFSGIKDVTFVKEPLYAKSNYWLNAILLNDISDRDDFLQHCNKSGVMSRPTWELMHKLPMFNSCFRGDLSVSEWIAERLVNIPSSVRI